MISRCQFLELLILPPYDLGRSSSIVRQIDHLGEIIGVPSYRLEVGTSDSRTFS